MFPVLGQQTSGPWVLDALVRSNPCPKRPIYSVQRWSSDVLLQVVFSVLVNFCDSSMAHPNRDGETAGEGGNRRRNRPEPGFTVSC